MVELPPFGPGRSPRDLTYDFAPLRVVVPLLVLRRRHCRKFQGFLALAIALRTVLGSGASLRLAAPNPVASSFGVAAPPHAGDVPVHGSASVAESS